MGRAVIRSILLEQPRVRTLTLPASSSHELIFRELRSRWHWIVVSTVVTTLGAVLYILLAPSVIVATTTVNIVAVTSVRAESSARSAASIIDMPTEIELARSALTAQSAANALGDGWSRAALMKGAGARGDTGGTVVKISYQDVDEDRARRGADALAAAYLQERVALVRERVEQQRSSIDEQIQELEKQLASTEDGRGRSIQARIDDLVSQRTTLMDPTDKAGQIITSASEASVYPSPAPKMIIVAGMLVGTFIGILLLFVRRAVSNTILSASELAELLRLPVWRAEPGQAEDSEAGVQWSESLHQTRTVTPFDREEAPERWAAPVELVLSACSRFPLLLVLDPRSPDADELFNTMKSSMTNRHGSADSGFLEVAEIDGPRWKLIRAASASPACVITVTRHSKRSHITQLVDELEATGCTCLGAFFLEAPAHFATDAGVM